MSSKPVEIVILNEKDDLDVPEEPDSDSEPETEKDQKVYSGGRTTPLTFFTTVGIARWMARAYGYVAKKKAEYQSQDKVTISNRNCMCSTDVCNQIKFMEELPMILVMNYDKFQLYLSFNCLHNFEIWILIMTAI